MRCANCNREVRPTERSLDETGMCKACGDHVPAFRPNRNEPGAWFLVADQRRASPMVVEGGQCEGCGLARYSIEPDGPHAWEAVCIGQDYDGEFLPGCGTRHPVRLMPACRVIWPPSVDQV